MQGENLVAGLGPLMQEGQPPAWLNYVTVADADESAGKARAAGGTVIVAPMDVMDAGRFAVIADSTGAVLGLWQPGRHRGSDIVNQPVSLTWNELSTRDVEAAKPFYKALFGWDAETHEMPGMEYTRWELDGKPIGGMMAMPAAVPDEVPAYWLAYFAVADTDTTIEQATSLGATLLAGPIDIPAGRFAVLMDPHGATFGVIKSGA